MGTRSVLGPGGQACKYRAFRQGTDGLEGLGEEGLGSATGKLVGRRRTGELSGAGGDGGQGNIWAGAGGDARSGSATAAREEVESGSCDSQE